MKWQKPVCPPCTGCGKQPKFVASMLDEKEGRTFHIFLCDCGDSSCTSEKSDEVALNQNPRSGGAARAGLDLH
jgi:hypothetical protein